MGSVRNLSWLVLEIGLPLVATIAMIYVYQALGAPRTYLGFVILGGALLAFWSNVVWLMAVQFMWDRGGGNLELYTMSPTSMTAILVGMAVGGILMTVGRAAAVVLIGSLLFGVTYQASGLLPAAGILLLTLCALYCLGMMLASLFLFYGREAWNIGNALQEPIWLLSGFYFPVRSLGALAGGVGSLVPLTLGLDAMRQLLLPGTPVFLPVGWEAAALVVQLIAYAALSQVALNFMEKRARTDGKLIMRWA
jgi:ABC-2 type transport system permease protein